jgi:hypothetical protein
MVRVHGPKMLDLYRRITTLNGTPSPVGLSSGVPDHRAHDDLLNAAALVVQALPLGAVRTATGRRRSRPMV